MEANKESGQQENEVCKLENGAVKEEVKPVENVEAEQAKENADKNQDSSTPEATPELLLKIKKQVEFYFGDVNMKRDKFLIEQTKLDDGWIPMTIMLNFKILASLSKDIEVILKSLEDSDLIEISEDRKKIRRSPSQPLPVYDEEYKKVTKARTVYLKGFPAESTIEDLKNFFEPTHAVENIIMRKYKKGKNYIFKGSIFLQFKTLEEAKAFMEKEPIEYKNNTLIRMWATEYEASKLNEQEERRQKKAQNKSEKNQDNKNNKERENKFNIPKGCILHMSNLKDNISREDIKEQIVKLYGTEVAYIDYNIGDVEGWIRLQGENAAVELIKKLDSDVLKVNDHDLPCKLVEGEEEEAYLAKVQENMKNQRNKHNKGRNGRQNFKRKGSPNRGGNAKKRNVDN